MAWTGSLGVSVGDATKESHYDQLVANAEYLQTLADVDHDFNVSTGTGKHKTVQFLADSTYNVGSAAARAAVVYCDTIGDSAQALGVASSRINHTPTLSSTSNIGVDFSATFAPSGASNDFAVQMLPSLSLDNAGTFTGIYNRLVSVASGKTLSTATGFLVADGVGAGTTTTQYGIQVNTLTKGGTNYAIHTGASGTIHLGSLTASQDVQTDGSSNLTTVSDRNWKRPLGDITPAEAIKIVRNLKPVYYDEARRQDGPVPADEKQHRLAGFYAQDVYEAFPEASPGGPNLDQHGGEHWGLNTRAIIAALTGAVQSLDAELATIKAGRN